MVTVVTSAYGDIIASTPYTPRDEDMFYLVSHSQQSLTSCLSPPACLLLLHRFFTGICSSSCGLHWNSQNHNQGGIQTEFAPQRNKM